MFYGSKIRGKKEFLDFNVNDVSYYGNLGKGDSDEDYNNENEKPYPYKEFSQRKCLNLDLGFQFKSVSGKFNKGFNTLNGLTNNKF